MDTTQLPRTRIIPLGDFFTRLQMEYVNYRFREMIYQRPFDKKKFADICVKKKEKIEQIALENCLPTVFNNPDQRERYLKKFFGNNGLPTFCYRDEYQERVKGYWDIFYYFIEGSSVRFILEGSVEIGRIQECVVKEKAVMIEYDHSVVVRGFDGATRLFPSTFYSEFFQ